MLKVHKLRLESRLSHHMFNLLGYIHEKVPKQNSSGGTNFIFAVLNTHSAILHVQIFYEETSYAMKCLCTLWPRTAHLTKV